MFTVGISVGQDCSHHPSRTTADYEATSLLSAPPIRRPFEGGLDHVAAVVIPPPLPISPLTLLLSFAGTCVSCRTSRCADQSSKDYSYDRTSPSRKTTSYREPDTSDSRRRRRRVTKNAEPIHRLRNETSILPNMPANTPTRPPPPVAQPPRLFVNTNGSGARFYYHDTSVTIQYFDPVSHRSGTFMPPVYEKQTFVCTDGTSFVFFPDGSGSYTFFGGTRPIAPGEVAWMPPRPVLVPVPTPVVVRATPPPRIRQAPPSEFQEEEDSSDDDEKTHRKWKLGLA
ncbi:hypothetical protein M409DRAFT_55862 [Zasmidium cellare ATCC 36951]|uniref:Uncharacterized protein n=1 Tax=Zasmidium cellare ATCC 36951 TaxID=1080233 RepID=A0A6A6CEE2_ZASCE|nr:uncharacterized protein M409DRAFT_55862 [Zasmidium cellare ATCC 36951]KAF2165475.1 hypothetical protein M409DRAFT_55862 [Zasmidium cellare ATCC 36951]